MNLTTGKGTPNEKTYLVVMGTNPSGITRDENQVTQYWPSPAIVLLHHNEWEWRFLQVGDTIDFNDHPWRVVETFVAEHDGTKMQWTVKGQPMTWAEFYEAYWQRGLMLCTCVGKKSELYIVCEWM